MIDKVGPNGRLLKPGADVRRLCEELGEALAKAHEGSVCITASDDRTSHDCECDATPT
jgi:hypothetical protein